MIKKLEIKKEFNTYKGLVEFVLRNYPYTRNSDTDLYFKCLRLLGINTLEEAEELRFNIVTVHKLRQIIQNKQGKYRPSEDIFNLRCERCIEVKNYILDNTTEVTEGEQE